MIKRKMVDGPLHRRTLGDKTYERVDAALDYANVRCSGDSTEWATHFLAGLAQQGLKLVPIDRGKKLPHNGPVFAPPPFNGGYPYPSLMCEEWDDWPYNA
jgi:hypothetical protein